VTAVDVTTEPADAMALRHGSMVTSAILYGAIMPGHQLPDPPANVVHHRVLPVPRIVSPRLPAVAREEWRRSLADGEQEPLLAPVFM
jgi:hypothetical protein